MTKNYKTLANKLHKANFSIAGEGYFGLNGNDVAELLRILLEENLFSLRNFYQELHQRNMGEDGHWYKGNFRSGKKEDWNELL